jgi:predicted metal-dependent phosphoesterase TrpH
MVSAILDVLGSADLHLHSLASDGLMTPEALVDHAEHVSRLDVIAITDHDELSAAFVAREYAARRGYHVQVAVGVEVTTREGHLLALFLEARPPALRPALETADWVRSRGGLCVAPHPFTRWTHSLGRGTLLALAERGLLAGVEVLNASPAGRRSHGRALQFVGTNLVASVAGSDAHMLRVVGLARTCFPGQGLDELRHAIETRATHAEGRFARPAEIATEALPQLARALVHLPLRRVARALSAAPAARRRSGDGAAL